MGRWMSRGVGGWIDEQQMVSGWVARDKMGGWTDGRMDRAMGGYMDVSGGVDRWIDEQGR